MPEHPDSNQSAGYAAPRQDRTFDDWAAEYRRLAIARDLDWLAGGAAGAAQREAWSDGLTPAEHLTALAEIAEWRGCGCGGS